jgi:hypothetical protein
MKSFILIIALLALPWGVKAGIIRCYEVDTSWTFEQVVDSFALATRIDTIWHTFHIVRESSPPGFGPQGNFYYAEVVPRVYAGPGTYLQQVDSGFVLHPPVDTVIVHDTVCPCDHEWEWEWGVHVNGAYWERQWWGLDDNSGYYERTGRSRCIYCGEERKPR